MSLETIKVNIARVIPRVRKARAIRPNIGWFEKQIKTVKRMPRMPWRRADPLAPAIFLINAPSLDNRQERTPVLM